MTHLNAASDLANRPDSLPVYTSEAIAGKRIQTTVGLVRGNTIRTRHLGNDILAIFRSMVGGEIPEYTAMMAQAREQALDRLRAEAVSRGCNAVIGLRFTTAMVMQGASEILAYGTGVILEDE